MKKDWKKFPHFAYLDWRLWIDTETGKFFIEKDEGKLSICVGTIYGNKERSVLFRFLNEFGEYTAEFGADAP